MIEVTVSLYADKRNGVNMWVREHVPFSELEWNNY